MANMETINSIFDAWDASHTKKVERSEAKIGYTQRALKNATAEEIIATIPFIDNTYNYAMDYFYLAKSVAAVEAAKATAKITKKVGEMPEVFTEILAYAQVRPVMMKGPAGTGKGFMSRKVAEALGAEFYEVNAVQNEYGLTGFVDANSRFVETPFYRACKSASEGKPTVFLFDEMDCSNDVALKIFNEALEAKEFTFPNNEKLEFKNLVILAACNTFGTGANEEYSGTRLDASTLNRFFVVTVGYERSVEMVMARHDVVLVDFIEAYRKAIETVQIKTIVSYRNIDMIAQMKGKLPMEKILKAALIKSLERDDVMMILNNMPEEVRNNNEYSKYLRKAA